MTNRPRGVLYTGVTSNLVERIWQHREGTIDGFTKRYRIKTLVWFEEHQEIVSAIQRERQIKEWKRNWKLNLIEGGNPYWEDLYPTIL